MDSIRLKARAKINLGLDVLGKRDNGYHDVRMVMQTVGIYDRLIINKIPEDDIRIDINLKFLPVNENNLIYKAYKLMKDEYGFSGGIEVDLNKFIPIAAGMAGGSTDDADLSKINLAYVLEDGQKVYIPKIGEINQENAEEEYITFEYGNNKNIIQDYNKGGNEKVNINTANQTELETLPGIGTATAEKIIDYRNKNGKFSSIEDIQNVKGIGNAKYENIKESICVK